MTIILIDIDGSNSPGLASQAEAEAGVENTKTMTALRVKQAIEALDADLLNNLTATAAPTADDDTGDGYAVGSLWVDVTADEVYQCVDATSTAAVWLNTTLNSADLDANTVKKPNVVTVATSNISLFDEQTINGVALEGDDRALLTGQTDKSENGPWVVVAGVYGAWTRPDDFATGSDAEGAWTHVEQGTEHDESIWFCVNDGPCVVDTDDQEWRKSSAPDIPELAEDDTNSSSDYISKHDGTSLEKIQRNDFIRPGIQTLTDGPTITIDLSDPEKLFTVELGGNRTLAIVNANPGDRFVLRLEQDDPGNRTVTWWSTINWPGGSAPTLTTTADKADYFEFVCTATNTYDCILVTQNLGTTAGSSTALGDDLLYYWHFNETSGNRVDEVSSSELGGGDLPGYDTGKSGNAADFNGSTNYLSSSGWQINDTELDIRDTDVSIAMWVNFDSVASDQALLNMWSAGVGLTGSTSKVKFTVTGSSTVSSIWSSALSGSTWYLIVCVHDSVNDLVKISVNGGTFQTEALSGGATDIPGAQSLLVGSTAFSGLMDGLAFWSKALSQAEVTELYNSGTGKFFPFV